MKRHHWDAVALLVVCVVLVIFGVFVLGFLGEPSAVGRVRTALVVIGSALILSGAAAGFAGARTVLARRR